MRLVSFTLALAIAFSIFVPPTAQAQGLPLPAELSVVLSPLYPRPYDTVTVTVKSTMLDLSASTITISVNGTTIAEGERTAWFVMHGPGEKFVVEVVTTDADGTHKIQKTISPADVALVVEPQTSVPPFYKGARLVASEGSVRLIALPDFQSAPGVRIPPQNLSYSWKFGDRILEAQSGLGKNVLSAIAPVRYRDALITLTVTTQDKALVAQSSVMVTPIDPFIRVYQNDPLTGIDLATALSKTFAMTADEHTFRAVPYFYSGSPKVAWTLNGTDSDQDPDLTVRTTGATKGTAVLGAHASDTNVINNAETRFTIEFGAARSTGIFGL